jgi:TPP-dependent pyruvate/acetoin dehydrogenase alpha subunit
MTHGHTRESLVAFRDRVAEAFKAKLIRSPVHFPGGNEEQVIQAFEEVRPGDWVLSNWRSMYHALLAGIPEEELFQMILDGRSMYIMDRARKFMASSIVGGMLPVAIGLGMGFKQQKTTQHVHCFVGDMTASIGLFHEAVQYAEGHDLPVRFIVENNGVSTNADTEQTWGKQVARFSRKVTHYRYRRTMPHVGLLERVSF